MLCSLKHPKESPKLNKKGKKSKVLLHFVAASLILSLSGALYLRYFRDDSPGADRQSAANSRSVKQGHVRRTAGELKQRALKRAPSAPETNNATPFVCILGAGATNYLGGIAALRELPAVISTNQTAALRSLVSTAYSSSMALSPLEFNGVKNVAADILLQQPCFPAEFIADLALQSADPAQDEVWRDYCLQMLTTGYLNLKGRSEADLDAPAARELALDVLMAAASAGGGTWPGTALLGLNTILASEPAAFPRAELDRRILSALGDASASEAAQITAIRLAGSSRMAAARPALDRLASSPSELVRNVAAKSLSELSTETSNNAIRQ